MNLSDLHLTEVHDTRPDRLIRENHYLGCVPAGARHRYLLTGGVMYGEIGAFMWGRPVGRMIDQENTIELTRFWTHPNTPKNAESWALSRMMADMVGKYRLLLSYASVGRHEGTIYKATNWANMGLRWPTGSWETREGRTDRDMGVKWRFEYW